MSPEETGNHHSVLQRTAEILLMSEEENRQLSGPIDPHFPLSTEQAKQTEKPHLPHLTKLIHSEDIFKSLGFT